MRKPLSTSLPLLFLTALASAALAGVALAVDGEARLLTVEITPDVVYGHKSGMALTYDVIQPAQANGAGILYMVSGGWFSRWSPPEKTAENFEGLLDKGFTVFAVRHGSAPRFKVPEAVEDVKLATRFIRLHAADYGVDSDRLGVFGGSAGGHLSLMLGTTGDEGDADSKDPALRESSRVAAVVAYFPPVDLRESVGPNDRFPALDFDLTLAAAVSPILHVSPDDVPTLMIHGDKDTLVPLHNSERILKAFEEVGVGTDLIVLEGAGHGFRGAHAETAREAMANWFETHLGGAQAYSEDQSTAR